MKARGKLEEDKKGAKEGKKEKEDRNNIGIWWVLNHLAEREREEKKRREKKEKKEKKKKRALHRIEPGSTDTNGYRPIRLQLILRDIGRNAYNSRPSVFLFSWKNSK